MPRPQRPFTATRRADSKTFQFTLNPASDLPDKVCRDWQRASFQKFPASLAMHRLPKNKAEAEARIYALIQHLKEGLAAGATKRIPMEDITAGAWLEKFTSLERNPRSALVAAKNRPHSVKTIAGYESYYRCHIKCDLISNKSIGRARQQRKMVGTRTFEGVVKFVRMAFKEYQRIHHKWFNPFQGLDVFEFKNIAGNASTIETLFFRSRSQAPNVFLNLENSPLSKREGSHPLATGSTLGKHQYSPERNDGVSCRSGRGILSISNGHGHRPYGRMGIVVPRPCGC